MKYRPHIPKVKPKFNVKDFVEGADKFGDLTAIHFLQFLKKEISKHTFQFDVIEQVLGVDENTLHNTDIANEFKAKQHLVFIKDGKLIDQITYKEMMHILQYGRKDKGLMPDPIIQNAFEAYRPIYRERLKNFLLGKK